MSLRETPNAGLNPSVAARTALAASEVEDECKHIENDASSGSSSADGDDSESSSDLDDRVAAFEARMAKEEEEEDGANFDDVVFDTDADALAKEHEELGLTGPAASRRRTWSLLRERWASEAEAKVLEVMERTIEEAAVGLQFDASGETTIAMGLVAWEGGRIFVGSDHHAKDVPALTRKNIRAVLCVHNTKLSQKRLDQYSGAGIAFCQVLMEDTFEEDLRTHLAPSFAFLEEWVPQTGVLVHCHVGQNRSAAVVVAFLMHKGLPLLDACRQVAQGRGIILASGSFPLQLLRLSTQEGATLVGNDASS